MNSLAYAILGILSRKPMSGYELGKQLELLWAANLSQIYPILSKLEKLEIVEFELVEQVGKPNKKTYYITEKGTDMLKEWIEEAPAEPVIRDEFIIKFYSIWLANPEIAIHLLHSRKNSYLKKLHHFQKEVTELKNDPNINHMDMSQPHFSRYLLLKRKIQILQFELDWCEEIVTLFSGLSVNK
ncbi:PadR family transcriptional regulator [Sporosarcina obsidiansis]|uniref:PadR family transcriptional regulator n=1 Tax=Sporosarcina obsidiansis TaxID=2660748 RepID=UPI00129B4058|nr:PadR family transcriptional regulator [Sporosarcina obsidiansis]